MIACVGVEEIEVDSRYGASFMKKKLQEKQWNIGDEFRFGHILSSRCLWDIQMELSSNQLDMNMKIQGVVGTGE